MLFWISTIAVSTFLCVMYQSRAFSMAEVSVCVNLSASTYLLIFSLSCLFKARFTAMIAGRRL
ncbi:hypothetical protein COU39_01465 [Candidatus Micrarchaeota archaeon CG10_big_fil_rev_8_21_14_0_10_60_32]|nr:MAG: hypothetical protein COU39_01465 [Candidatus Micrarchaeota archaeon CG10_big_fil_rev_8_21_14_0_10_60_32]PIY91590.1 MAG: hypothetical protein COY71_02330 [Candidatus Micrarchaeota archaeon CG_4_10_14_0_8_um_filter_60_7]